MLLGYVSSHHLGETEVLEMATVIELSLTFFHYALLPAIHLRISSVKKRNLDCIKEAPDSHNSFLPETETWSARTWKWVTPSESRALQSDSWREAKPHHTSCCISWINYRFCSSRMYLRARFHLCCPYLAKCQVSKRETCPHHRCEEVKAAMAVSLLNRWVQITLLRYKNGSEHFRERRWNVFQRESADPSLYCHFLPRGTIRQLPT